MLGQPAIKALLAMLLLGEPLSLWQILGGTIVMAGVYTVHHTRSESRQLATIPWMR
jgi:drug/metabolite transporter (DMT)-like permease